MNEYMASDLASDPEKINEWQKEFLDAGTKETGIDLSVLIPVVSKIISEQSNAEEVEKAYHKGFYEGVSIKERKDDSPVDYIDGQVI